MAVEDALDQMRTAGLGELPVASNEPGGGLRSTGLEPRERHLEAQPSEDASLHANPAETLNCCAQPRYDANPVVGNRLAGS